MKTFCFKLYQSDHNNALTRQISIAGLIYNHCIALHRRYYRLFRRYISAFTLQKHLTKLKRTKRFRYMRKLDAQAVQDVAQRIDRAYKLFWRNLEHGVKSSPPKFKKVRKYTSFTLHQHNWKLDEANMRIYLCGRCYKYFQSRHIEGKIKAVTIKRDALGDIYVYLVADGATSAAGDDRRPACRQLLMMAQSYLHEPPSEFANIIGFDFGLKRFLTASDGHDIISPDFFMQNVNIIRKKHRNLSRKKEGSNNREYARLDLARAYRKMDNQRKDFHFKLARKLCEQYAAICLEDLNIKGMARLWGRKIQSLGFSEFVKILHHEALKAGTRIISVDRYYPSSQLYSVCGYKNGAVKDLRVREWDCPSCHTHHDRDRNAARNILRGGASSLSGDAVRPEKSGSVVEAKIPLFQ